MCASVREPWPADGSRLSLSAPPRWALVSAALAPIALISGWLIAGALQPPGFDPIQQSISELASDGAAYRIVMTVALVVIGGCHLVTAAGLTSLRPSARALLACGGIAGVLVAAFPQPANGTSYPHIASAMLGAVALTLWAAFAGSRDRSPPLDLRTGLIAAAIIGVSVVVMLAAANENMAFGLTERVSTALQSAWPLVLVIALRVRAPVAAT